MLGLEAGLEHAWKIIMEHNDHPDILEGGKAFMEKRAPRWRGVGEEGS